MERRPAVDGLEPGPAAIAIRGHAPYGGPRRWLSVLDCARGRVPDGWCTAIPTRGAQVGHPSQVEHPSIAPNRDTHRMLGGESGGCPRRLPDFRRTYRPQISGCVSQRVGQGGRMSGGWPERPESGTRTECFAESWWVSKTSARCPVHRSTPSGCVSQGRPQGRPESWYLNQRFVRWLWECLSRSRLARRSRRVRARRYSQRPRSRARRSSSSGGTSSTCVATIQMCP
jgi:hypothetical protein